jgi:hypothetical protein
MKTRKQPLQYTGGKMLVLAPDGLIVGSLEEARELKENYKPFSQINNSNSKSA